MMSRGILAMRRSSIASPIIRAALLSGWAAAIPIGAHAATQQEEDACRPDVFRLCASAIPSEDAIVSCLNANLTRLGPACRAVMDPPTAQVPATRRQRATHP